MTDKLQLRALLKAIRKISRAVDLQSRRIDRSVGLTLPQLVVLGCVRDLGEVTSRAISEQAELSPATVVGILDKLEAKALVERYRSRIDRRIVHTRLTKKGIATLAAAPSPLGQAFEQAFLKLPARERDNTLAAIQRVASLSVVETEDELAQAGPQTSFGTAEPDLSGSTARASSSLSNR